uniref:Uncharacterized protein n=1 Tax=Oryza nivara TaxID=4536 RepID=A0A0E0FIX2_ORYNI
MTHFRIGTASLLLAWILSSLRPTVARIRRRRRREGRIQRPLPLHGSCGRLHSSFGSHRFSAPLSCGSVGGGDGRGGSGDLFPSRMVPVVSPPPSLSHGSAAGDDGRDGPGGLSYGDDGDGFQEVSMSTTRPSASSGHKSRFTKPKGFCSNGMAGASGYLGSYGGDGGVEFIDNLESTLIGACEKNLYNHVSGVR